MQRKFLFLIALSLVTFYTAYPAQGFAQERSALFPDGELQRFGLTRSWFTQVQIDTNTTFVRHVLLDRGTLFVVTSDSRLIAIDAESGKTVWSRSVGQPGQGTFSPGANSRVVGAVNGADIYIFDRRNGRLIWRKTLPFAPTAACQMTDFYVYTPMVDNQMSCYPLEEQLAPSEILLELVPRYAELGYTLDPFTGKVTADKILRGSTRLKAEKSKALLDATLEGEKDKRATLKNELTDSEKLAADELKKDLIKDSRNVNKPYYLKPGKMPMTCYSFGLCTQQPVICSESDKSESLAWFTDRGFLFVANGTRDGEHRFELRHKLTVTPQISYLRVSKIGKKEESIANDILFTPSVVQKNPDDPESKFLLIVGTSSGLVIAYDPHDAVDVWCQSIGSPVNGRTEVVKNHIYVPCLDGNMYCLNSADGKPLWASSGVKEFVAASPTRVYAKNFYDELLAIDPESGSQTTLCSLRPYEIVYHNAENDRVYLITKNGLIQCLHEIGQAEPVRHTFAPEVYLELKENAEAESQTPKQAANVKNTSASDTKTVPAASPSTPGQTTPSQTPAGLIDDPFNTTGTTPTSGKTASPVTTPAPAKPAPASSPSGASSGDDPFEF
ncbi:MAG: PQQ-binding-like beta-propeller repeat protein [Planctomycetaceae bacterium]|nr:PQQ-binding-like beta-propeller repeat protein [Planctomycetaceae bacterium]